MMRILIAEDDESPRKLIVNTLKRNQYLQKLEITIDEAKTCNEAIELIDIHMNQYTLAIVDLGMEMANYNPEKTAGMVILEKLENDSPSTYKIVLTAAIQGQIVRQYVGIANDYIFKTEPPYNIITFIINKIIELSEKQKKNVISYGNIKFDYDENQIYIYNKLCNVILTPAEREIFTLLLKNPKIKMPAKTLFDYYNTMPNETDYNLTVSKHINNINNKFNLGYKLIKNQRGIGYYIDI